MNKIYYLTRSFYPYQKGGGAQMRKGAVDHLRRQGWDITVVLPNYNSRELVEHEGIIQYPLHYFQEFELFKQRVGLQEDYLDRWTNSVCHYLAGQIEKNDIVFATTGGELGPIKLASLLKKETGCRFVANYRDPILEGKYLGKIVDGRFHVSRDKVEEKYLQNCDLILTFSEKFKSALAEKFPHLTERIQANYFGFPNAAPRMKDVFSQDGKRRIAFAGRMGKFQKPDMLIEAIKKCRHKEDIELYFIGVFTKYLPFRQMKNVNVIEFMPPGELSEMLLDKIDVGFVSLSDEYHIFGVPSKIYEYINLGLPILAALPKADGLRLINENEFGVACVFSDIKCITNALDQLFEPGRLEKYRLNIARERDKWSMAERIKEVDHYLRKLITT